MERRQILTVLIMVLLLLGALMLTLHFSEDGPARRTGGFRFKQGPRRAGTTVNKSLYDKLVGSGRGDGYADSDNDLPDADPEKKKSTAHADSPEEAAAAHALNALTPQLGIERLRAQLAALENLEHASRLYAALGTLYAQNGETSAAQADQAFAKAKQLARSNEDRHRAALAYVNALSARGDTETAAKEAAAALNDAASPTVPGVQLTIAQARLFEKQGQDQKAETAYKKAMEDALPALPALGQDAANVYRQACLALVQLYRRTGRQPQADALIITMKRNLAE